MKEKLEENIMKHVVGEILESEVSGMYKWSSTGAGQKFSDKQSQP